MFVGDGVKNEVEKVIRNLRLPLQLRLQFISHHGKDENASVGSTPMQWCKTAFVLNWCEELDLWHWRAWRERWITKCPDSVVMHGWMLKRKTPWDPNLILVTVLAVKVLDGHATLTFAIQCIYFIGPLQCEEFLPALFNSNMEKSFHGFLCVETLTLHPANFNIFFFDMMWFNFLF